MAKYGNKASRKVNGITIIYIHTVKTAPKKKASVKKSK